MATKSDYSAIDFISFEAERAILGSMLLGADTISEAVSEISQYHFYDINNRMLFETIEKMFRESKEVDLLTLDNELKKRSDYANLKFSGPDGTAQTVLSFLADLNEKAYSTAVVKHHCQIVKEKALQRAILKKGQQLIALDPFINPYDLVSSTIADMEKLLTATIPTAIKSPRKFSESIKAEIKQEIENGSTYLPITADLTKTFKRGIKSGKYIVVGARPGCGKTSMAVNLAYNIAVRHEIPTLFFTIEMTELELTLKMVSHHTKVDYEEIEQHIGQYDELISGYLDNVHSNTKLLIDSSKNLTERDVTSRIYKAHRDQKIQCVVIDYIQKLYYSAKENTRALEVKKISQAIFAITKQLGITTFVLAQLNRDTVGKRRPVVSDLKESGDIEQDADIVILLDNPCISNNNAQSTFSDGENAFGKVDVIVGKNRGGKVGLFTRCMFKGGTSEFLPIATESEFGRQDTPPELAKFTKNDPDNEIQRFWDDDPKF